MTELESTFAAVTKTHERAAKAGLTGDFIEIKVRTTVKFTEDEWEELKSTMLRFGTLEMKGINETLSERNVSGFLGTEAAKAIRLYLSCYGLNSVSVAGEQ